MPKVRTFTVEITTTKETDHLSDEELRSAIDSAVCFWVEEGQHPFRDQTGKLWADWQVRL